MAVKKSTEDYAAEAEGPVQPIREVGNNMDWKHVMFARTLFQTGDRIKAVREAGYRAKDPSRTAYALLKRDDVKRYLLALQTEADDKAVITVADVRHEVNQILDEALKDARTGDPVIGKNGSAVMDPATGQLLRKPNVMAKVKVAEVKGRSVGMFTDVQRIEGEMESMDDATLTAFIVAAVTANPGLCKAMADIDGVKREVHAADERARSGEGAERGQEQEVEPVLPAPEASGASEGRFH